MEAAWMVLAEEQDLARRRSAADEKAAPVGRPCRCELEPWLAVTIAEQLGRGTLSRLEGVVAGEQRAQDYRLALYVFST
jgi:hypothetical protein